MIDDGIDTTPDLSHAKFIATPHGKPNVSKLDESLCLNDLLYLMTLLSSCSLSPSYCCCCCSGCGSDWRI